ncbi:MAG: hypothetical protein F6J89_28110 [Symploca sp. SIO1C4]|uniref:Uncharacterized protein n=1 Tax=Symploca sp. SIO1C4 TaxID=2607765 RepID=A0A6B3NKG2_9CYAN|nr:hypothetical protein [Symploca sp. SIO1C4]
MNATERLIMTGIFALMGFCYSLRFSFATIQAFFSGILHAFILGLASWLILSIFRNSDWTEIRLVMIGRFTIVGFFWGSLLPFALTLGSTPIFVGGLFGALFLGLATWFISQIWKRINYWVYGLLCLVVLLYLLTVNFRMFWQSGDCASVGNIFFGGFQCYYRPNLIIDTVLPPEFSEDKFFSIKPGMDRNEVIALLGQPRYPRLDLDYGKNGGSDWWDFAWIGYYVEIDDNDKVTGTDRYIFHD